MFTIPKKVNLKTYQAGLLQAKAYRNLHGYMSESLKAYNITLPEWGLLGLLYDKKKLSPTILSLELGVKPPVTTAMLRELETKNLIERTSNPDDNRGSSIELSHQGKQLLPRIEKELRRDLGLFLKDIRINDLVTYMNVLQKLSQK